VRIPLPERIPLSWATLIAFLLAVVQVFEGTGLIFALLHICFILLWVIAFNLAGGFTRATGSYVFWLGLFTLLLGTVARALIGDPADSVSLAPNATMLVYTASMAAMLVAVVVARHFTKNVRSVAERVGSYRVNYRSAALGCLVMDQLIWNSGPFVPASMWTAYNGLFHLDFFSYLSIILGTIDAVQSSGGKRSFNWINTAALGLMFFRGFVTFSKEGMYTPVACWLIGVAYTRYRLSWLETTSLVAFALFASSVLYPVANFGRFEFQDETSQIKRFEDGVSIILDIQRYWGYLDETEAIAKDAGYQGYFSKDLGITYRFTRWYGDDLLVAYTLKGNTEGYGYMRWQLLNWFPHLLLPDKDKYAVDGGGNYYARELGIINSGNTSTGISFSPFAEAFHIDSWAAVLMLQPLVWILFFMSMDVVCGDLRRAPWGLFFAVVLSHFGPERGLSGLMQFITTFNIGMIGCMWFAVTAAPLIGSVFFQRLPGGGVSPAPLGPLPAIAGE
jgi:hypothetical protein